MQLLPIKTPLLKPGNDLAAIIAKAGHIQGGDIVVISSKAVATVEGRLMDLLKIKASEEAKKWAKLCHRSVAFCQAVIAETKLLNGSIKGHCPGALLTEVRPRGLKQGVIFTANAGLDESNVQKGWAVGWPEDAVKSVITLRTALEEFLYENFDNKKYGELKSPVSSLQSPVAIILSDSCCALGRFGVTAFALTVSGLDPIRSEIGRRDMYGKPLTITTEAIADQLATAANFVMGNAEQAMPAVIIRDHGLAFSNYEGWVDGVEPLEDLFSGLCK